MLQNCSDARSQMVMNANMLKIASYAYQKIIIITHHPNKEAIFNDGVSDVRRVPGCANKYHVRRSRLPADKQQIT